MNLLFINEKNVCVLLRIICLLLYSIIRCYNIQNTCLNFNTLMHEEFKLTICNMLFNTGCYMCTIITLNIFGRFHLKFAQTCAPALILIIVCGVETTIILHFQFNPLLKVKEYLNINTLTKIVSVLQIPISPEIPFPLKISNFIPLKSMFK